MRRLLLFFFVVFFAIHAKGIDLPHRFDRLSFDALYNQFDVEQVSRIEAQDLVNQNVIVPEECCSFRYIENLFSNPFHYLKYSLLMIKSDPTMGVNGDTLNVAYLIVTHRESETFVWYNEVYEGGGHDSPGERLEFCSSVITEGYELIVFKYPDLVSENLEVLNYDLKRDISETNRQWWKSQKVSLSVSELLRILVRSPNVSTSIDRSNGYQLPLIPLNLDGVGERSSSLKSMCDYYLGSFEQDASDNCTVFVLRFGREDVHILRFHFNPFLGELFLEEQFELKQYHEGKCQLLTWAKDGSIECFEN